MEQLSKKPIMRWLLNKGIKPGKAYEAIQYAGGVCFFLSILSSILLQAEEELPAPWAQILSGAAAVLFLAFLLLSAYCNYVGNLLWLWLLLFGPVSILMGLVIDLGTVYTVVFVSVGAAVTGAGIWLTPRQRRRDKAIRADIEQAEAEAAKKLVEKFFGNQNARSAAQTVSDAPRPDGNRSVEKDPVGEIEKLQNQLITAKRLLENANTAGNKDTVNSIENKVNSLRKELGAALLRQESLYVLALRSTMEPYMGSDGRMEFFSSKDLARMGKKVLMERLKVDTDVMTLSGNLGVTKYFNHCAHNGYTVLRLNNGTAHACELWLKDFVPSPCENLIDEKNRSLRMMLHRAKQYSWQLSRQPDRNAPHCLGLSEIMLTMQANAYRDMSNGLVYVLANPMQEETLYATEAAQTKLEQWLPGSGFENTMTVQHPDSQVKLNLFYVNRPGEKGQMEKGFLCVFTDLEQAKQGQASFRKEGMDNSILVITYDELLPHASQCAGMVVDMYALSYEIPGSEYSKIEQYRKLDAPVIFHLKNSEQAKKQEPNTPVLREAKMQGAWKKFDYQWPHRFGYDYILRSVQWVIDNEMPAQTLVTAAIAGAPEVERIEKYRETNSLADTIGQETGMVGIGGFSPTVGTLTKVYWYNQTNVVRVFTAGDQSEEAVNRFITKLLKQ